MEIINRRRSVRSYTDQPIEKEKMETLLRAAMQAPSACNQQPWHFLVIQDKETMRKIVEASPRSKMVSEAAAVIFVLLDNEHMTVPLMGPQDGSAATMNILLAATEMGIGSVWCGVYPNPDRMDTVMKVLNIPSRYKPFSMIPLGYPKDPDALHFTDRFDPAKVSFEKI